MTAFHALQDPISDENVSMPLGRTTLGMGVSIAAPGAAVSIAEDQRTGAIYKMPHTHALAQAGGKPGQGYLAVRIENAVRRLTPTECCRLQGLPDDWLGEPNEPPDSPRYAALGDAVTVPVAEWVGRKILEAEENLRRTVAA